MHSPIISEKFNEIDGYIKELIQNNSIPNALLLLYKEGEVKFLQKYGWANKEKLIPIEFDSIFRIYSMTKPIIAVGLMMLFEQGKFRLDEPIKKYIPEFGNSKVFVRMDGKEIITEELQRDITILDLLTHTSGITYFFYEETDPVDKLYNNKMDYDKIKDLSLEKVMKILANLPLRFQPGTYFRYGHNFDVIARLIEILSGQPLEQYLKEKIFIPLEMKDTSFYVPEENFHRFATLYITIPGPSLFPIDLPVVIDRYRQNKHTFLSGGEGLVSTMQDYLNFTQIFLNRGNFNEIQLLQPETVDLITQNHLKGNKTIVEASFAKEFVSFMQLYSHGQGLGVRVCINDDTKPFVKGEHGWIGFGHTYYWIDPKNEVIGIFLTQVITPKIGIVVYDGKKLVKLAYNGLQKV